MPHPPPSPALAIVVSRMTYARGVRAMLRVQQVSVASEPGNPGVRNDDWAGATASGIAVVVDGVTESGETGCVHGTAWYVHQLGSRIIASAGTRARTLADSLAEAIAEVRAGHGGGCDLSHPGSPAATVAALRVRDDVVEYLVLSDAVVVLDTGPEPLVVTDPSARLALPELAADAARGTQTLATLIEAQQRLRNRPGGYWLAQHDPQAAAHALTGSVANVDGAVLLTDGAALLVTDFGAISWRELLDVVYASGPAGLLAATREVELRDASRTVWPRYKTHDDATAIALRFATSAGG